MANSDKAAEGEKAARVSKGSSHQWWLLSHLLSRAAAATTHDRLRPTRRQSRWTSRAQPGARRALPDRLSLGAEWSPAGGEGRWRVPPTVEDVEAFAEQRRSGQPISYTGRRRDWAGLQRTFYGAAVAGDETGARRVFERLHLARVPMLEQCEQLVVPFARRLEADFSDGVLLAGQVRLAATMCERQLRWATGLVRHAGDHLAVVVTPQEEHTICRE